jgi:hypothetical protein
MTYDDVKGKPRFWKVTFDPANPNVDLKKDDQLVFDGDNPDTITRYRLKLPSPWGTSCSSINPALSGDYTIKGDHNGHMFTINFVASTDSTKASHQGTIFDLPDPNPSPNRMSSNGSWMADEGP